MHFLRSNPFFVISLLLAIIAVIFGGMDWTSINWDVIVTLLGMMIVLVYFDRSLLLRRSALALISVSADTRAMVQRIIAFSFVSSFLLSNDVTVMTVLPIYLHMISLVGPFRGRTIGAALIPIAANMGGILFPFSNPQNLIIYDYFRDVLPLPQFLRVTAPLMLFSFFILMAITFLIERRPCQTDAPIPTTNRPLVIQGTVGLILMILSVFHIIPPIVACAIVCAWTAARTARYFLEIDYTLLGTFVCFFIIVGVINQSAFIQQTIAPQLQTPVRTALGAILLSQGLSNVPATILMKPFITAPAALLLGVNIGGLGTILASMTNLIGYSIFAKNRPKIRRRYLLNFSLLNIALIILFTSIFIWFVI